MRARCRSIHEDTIFPLENVTLTVEAVGVLVELTLEFAILNRSSFFGEANVDITLPHGTTVVGYAMEVDGVLVEGVIVEKAKATEVLESEKRAERTVSVLAHKIGNVFDTFVTLQRQSQRRFRLIASGCFSQLSPTLAEFRMDIDPCQLSLNLAAPDQSFFNCETVQLTSSTTDTPTWKANQAFSGPLRLQLRTGRLTGLLAVDFQEGIGYALLGDSQPPHGPRRPAPRSLLVLWDASRSRLRDSAALRIELSTLAAVLGELDPNLDITLCFFSTKLAIHQFRADQLSALKWAIEKIEYNGATDFSLLETIETQFWPRRFDLVFLFSDGLATLGKLPSTPVRSSPLHTFSASQRSDRGALRASALASSGAFFPLPLPTPIIVDTINRSPSTLFSVQDPHIRSGFPRAVSVTGPTVVAYKLTAERLTDLLSQPLPSLELIYATEVRSVPLCPIGRPEAFRILRRFWASQRLSQLLEDEAAESAVIRLSRKYQIASPLTSFVVLETPQQFLDHDIEPPAQLPEHARLYRLLRAAAGERRLEQDARHLRAVAQLQATRRAFFAAPSPVSHFVHALPYEAQPVEFENWFQEQLALRPRLNKRIYIPDAPPDYNYIGLLVGPRGLTQKKIQMATGARITVHAPRLQDPLVNRQAKRQYVELSADTPTQLAAAEAQVNSLLTVPPEPHWLHKRSQLRQLAEINGTIRNRPAPVQINATQLTREALPVAPFEEEGQVLRRQRLRQLALECIDPKHDAYFMRNHLGAVEPATTKGSLGNVRSWTAKGEEREAKKSRSAPAQPHTRLPTGPGGSQEEGNPTTAQPAPRLALNKYYPPDFDPSLLPRGRTSTSDLAAEFTAEDIVKGIGTAKDVFDWLSNLLEVELNPPNLRFVGYWCLVNNHPAVAPLLLRVLELRPDQPQSFRDLAHALAPDSPARLVKAAARFAGLPATTPEDLPAQLLAAVVSRRWAPVYGHIEASALLDLQAYASHPCTRSLAHLLQPPLTYQIRCLIAWSHEVDLELAVTEPTGDRLTSLRPTSRQAMLTRNFSAGLGPQEYLARQAAPGTYSFAATWPAAGRHGPTAVGLLVELRLDTGTDAKELMRHFYVLTPAQRTATWELNVRP